MNEQDQTISTITAWAVNMLRANAQIPAGLRAGCFLEAVKVVVGEEIGRTEVIRILLVELLGELAENPESIPTLSKELADLRRITAGLRVVQ
ncbi:hypothetical protein FBZ89_104395 [Nitrospirillum amazonense]|uniref:Uncharacterized protein n=1 Tax=Nitrospirillum amazonense TaxID=28077 RepID=A0A560FKL0_9PROT|nr:hypothetical protein [Nitrospirillum amazonense]TWB22145.1 hypothetical protein FBZ89_104395 [Nitrospirillum amazonense]